MVSLLIGLLLTAVLLKLVASILPDLEIDGWAPAFGAALIVRLAGIAFVFVLGPLMAPFLGVGGWVTVAIDTAISVVALAVALAVAPGIKAGGAIVILAAAVIVSVLGAGIKFAIRYADTEGTLAGFI